MSRATNLGFKNPHQIFQTPFYDVKTDNVGKTTQFMGKEGGVQKPRARTADRFEHQYSKNYSTNSNLSPNTYNPIHGTIAGELKRRTTFRYVEDAIGSKTPDAYTICGDLKIYNPEVLSPKYKKAHTPMHSKSKSIDLGAGFKRRTTQKLNSLMMTLEKKVDYEQEAIKALGTPKAKQYSPSPVYMSMKTPAKQPGSPYNSGLETPPTAYTTSTPLNATFSTMHMLSSPSNSFYQSIENTPKQILSKKNSVSEFSHHNRNRSLPNAGILTKQTEQISQFAQTSSNQTDNHFYNAITEAKSDKYSNSPHSNSSVNTSYGKQSSQHSTTKSSRSNASFENRFEKPNDKVGVLTVDLKDYSKKLSRAKGAAGDNTNNNHHQKITIAVPEKRGNNK